MMSKIPLQPQSVATPAHWRTVNEVPPASFEARLENSSELMFELIFGAAHRGGKDILHDMYIYIYI